MRGKKRFARLSALTSETGCEVKKPVNKDEDMKALLLGAAAMNAVPLSFLLPVRQASFFGWCLSEGLRAVMPTTMMTMGQYQEPDGCHIPSIQY
jgi:hypothetical protein